LCILLLLLLLLSLQDVLPCRLLPHGQLSEIVMRRSSTIGAALGLLLERLLG